jgi:hypothetical protein
MENSSSLKAPRSSVTRTVNVKVPAVVGVPEMVFPLRQLQAGTERPGNHPPGEGLDPTAGERGRISIVKVSVSVARVQPWKDLWNLKAR